MSREYLQPTQVIHPYHFGEPFEKRTCLWLKGVPKLKHTNVVKPIPKQELLSGKKVSMWYATTSRHHDRAKNAKIRSKTFMGIARATAEQWS